MYTDYAGGCDMSMLIRRDVIVDGELTKTERLVTIVEPIQ